jgi:hypothetical protein
LSCNWDAENEKRIQRADDGTCWETVSSRIDIGMRGCPAGKCRGCMFCGWKEVVIGPETCGAFGVCYCDNDGGGGGDIVGII